MKGILALLPNLIAILPTLTMGVQEVITLIEAIRTAATQSEEWTPELEAAWVAALFDLAKRPQWQPSNVGGAHVAAGERAQQLAEGYAKLAAQGPGANNPR